MNPRFAPTSIPDGMGCPETADGAFPRTVRHFAGSNADPGLVAARAVLGDLAAAMELA
ncbi:MAG: hypothetical protein QM777_13695 [Pseudorhodoferax sp.]